MNFPKSLNVLVERKKRKLNGLGELMQCGEKKLEVRYIHMIFVNCVEQKARSFSVLYTFTLIKANTVSKQSR